MGESSSQAPPHTFCRPHPHPPPRRPGWRCGSLAAGFVLSPACAQTVARAGYSTLEAWIPSLACPVPSHPLLCPLGQLMWTWPPRLVRSWQGTFSTPYGSLAWDRG